MLNSYLGVTHSQDWWVSWQWGKQPLPCDSSKMLVVWMQPSKQSTLCKCTQKMIKAPALLESPACWKHMLSWQKPAASKSGGSQSLADALTGYPHVCVLGLRGRAKKAGEHATWPTCLGLPRMTHPAPAQKHCLHCLRKVKQPHLVVAFGELAYCACSYGENTRSQHLGGFPWIDTTQCRGTELQCCPSFCPTLLQTQVIHAGSPRVAFQGSAAPLQGCWGSAPFLVPSLISKRNVALKGQFGGIVTSQLDVLKGVQLRLLWLQHSSVFSVVTLKVGSSDVEGQLEMVAFDLRKTQIWEICSASGWGMEFKIISSP